MGCFWGAERMFWQAPHIYTTAAGYAGGFTPNPTYQEVCSGQTGHTEVVLAAFDPAKTSFEEMLRIFWEGHDPTQGMRQGNDVGTQYRSAIYWTSEAQREAALASRDMFQGELSRAGYGEITTEIAEAGPFYYAEDYHQQYLAANPNGYCGLGGTGVSCPAQRQRRAPDDRGSGGHRAQPSCLGHDRLQDVARTDYQLGVHPARVRVTRRGAGRTRRTPGVSRTSRNRCIAPCRVLHRPCA